ncbi:uncharacterized protein LOC142098477 [Mixophyes fleayi]|uniref:uncharacterized protein LOC142098477 n=1 Tax=Mixophyes fleayi TaxID=3061075 RepID=UPI003F4D767F
MAWESSISDFACVCPVSGEDSSAAVTRLLGKFSSFASFADFSSYIPNFNGLSATQILSPVQIANLALTEDVLSDSSKAELLITGVSGLSFTQLDGFLSSFQATAEQKNIVSLPNLSIRASLFSAIYSTVSRQYSSFSTEQWISYWQGKFRLFLPSITESQIQLIPNNINCNAFQTIISACGSQYSAFSEGIKQAIANKASSYLSAQKIAAGSACPTNTGDSGVWLNSNFGSFSKYFTLTAITNIFPGFQVLSAVNYLTAEQLGSYIANKDILADQDKIAQVLTGISSATIGSFMDAFNAAASQMGITSISNAQVKTFFLGEIFCKLGSAFSSFTSADYISWFQGRLTFFTSSIDAKALGFLPTDIDCDSLAAIIGGLKDVQHPSNPDAVYNFAKSVLQAQLANNGVACTANGLDSRGWLIKYFGQYISSATWSDISGLYPNFQVMEVTDLLTQVQLGSAVSSTSIIHNSTAITTLVYSFSGTIEEFYSFVGSIRNNVLLNPSLMSNPKVKESFLMMIAQVVFSSFTDMSLSTTQNWITEIGFLLPSINATMLDFIPNDISCDQYQSIVSALDATYSTLTIQKKKDIATFEMNFLTSKANIDGSPCSDGIRNTAQYAQKNFGTFCSEITADDVAVFYPSLDTVSFTQYCSLS